MAFPWITAPASDVAATAAGLLGWELRANEVTIRLTEIEAYSGQGQDPASHAHRGPTPRSRVMFGSAGVAYLYFVFGVHWCLNMVLGQPGEAAAVLFRAGQVIDGGEVARARRGGVPDRELARGPARLVIALGLDGTANGSSMIDGSGPILIAPPSRPVSAEQVSAGPRVGVASAAELPWRFWVTGDATVSPYRRHVPRVRPSGT